MFLEYDTTVQTYMLIKVKLDVRAPLKRKKNILVGEERIFYAWFQYEKLSLFCFIYGKMVHGESFCPLRVRMDPMKIVFGWDVSFRVAAKRRAATINRWLREADGSLCCFTEKEGIFMGVILRIRLISRGICKRIL